MKRVVKTKHNRVAFSNLEEVVTKLNAKVDKLDARLIKLETYVSNFHKKHK